MYVQGGFGSGDTRVPEKKKHCLVSSVRGGPVSFVLSHGLHA